MSETKVPDNKAYKVTLILLVGLAAFSTALKDLNSLQEMVSNVREFSTKWRGTDLVMLNVESVSSIDSCPDTQAQPIKSSVESDSIERVAPDRGMDRIWGTEPQVGGKVELVASKRAERSMSVTRARHARARNLSHEISAKRRDGRWPARFEFKTFDHVVTLDLPINATDIEALGNEIPRDVSLSLLRKMNRKQTHGKIDNGSREFILKRFERSISSRRAS